MTEEPSDHDEQLEGSLAYLLDGRMDVHDVLPLTAPLEELILSIRHSRWPAWRHDQRESLAVDMDVSGRDHRGRGTHRARTSARRCPDAR